MSWSYHPIQESRLNPFNLGSQLTYKRYVRLVQTERTLQQHAPARQIKSYSVLLTSNRKLYTPPGLANIGRYWYASLAQNVYYHTILHNIHTRCNSRVS